LLALAIVVLAMTSTAEALAAALVALVFGTAVLGQSHLLPRIARLAVPLGLLVFLLSYFSAGWEEAVAALLRLLSISTAAVLVFGSTPPEDLGNALVAGGMPYPAAFVLMAAMQFVPVISRRAMAVRDAQMARGTRLDVGFGSLRNYPVLALPVLYQSFKLADDLAEALESRGFARPGRTFRKEFRLTGLDWLVVVLATALTIGYAYWVRVG
jgi:energy-coupling factor transport system permease protein